MAADLLFEGDTIIIEKDWYSEKGERDSSEYTYVAKEDGLGAGRYYVMLLDSGSASCTEIFATAITSNLNSPIVGTNSYGKGIGQTYALTPDSAFASATSILFFDKNHETYHTHGLVPDHYIVDSDSALNKAVELAKGAKEKRTAGYGSDTQPTWRTASVKKKKLGKELSPSEAIKEVKRGGAFRILSGL
jgi:carboxyl-terminal processing protease